MQCKVTVKPRLSRTKVILVKNEIIYLYRYLKGTSIKSVSSSKPEVASVRDVKTGKIIGRRRGTATITVVDKTGRKYTCIIKVEEPYRREKYITLEEGQSYRLRIKGNTQEIDWSSNNRRLALVDSHGLVTARSKGKTDIFAYVGPKRFIFHIQILEKKSQK